MIGAALGALNISVGRVDYLGNPEIRYSVWYGTRQHTVRLGVARFARRWHHSWPPRKNRFDWSARLSGALPSLLRPLLLLQRWVLPGLSA